MHRIPPEILCNIFLAALPHPTDPIEYPSSVVAPLRISHVCRAWRNISLSFGELWSYLCIEYDFSSPHSTPGKRRMDLKATGSVFDTWIERTNGAPLNFRVECRSRFSGGVVEHIITTMISQQHRWRDVTLTCWRAKFSPEFPGLNMTNMPILTSLKLNLLLPLHAEINIAPSSRLRRLCIRATDFDLMTGEEPLCSLMESAEISVGYDNRPGSHNLRMCLDVLKAAPFLTEFIANFDRHTYLPLPRAQSELLIRLPNLRDLKLQSHPASFIIDYVTIPNLLVLFFVCNWYDQGVKAKMLTSFIRRSTPPLTTLVMDWDRVHEDLIIPTLHLLPTLKYLRLFGANVTKRFFHKLTLPGDTDANILLGDEHTTACPVLETLFLRNASFIEDVDSWAAFTVMIKSRPRGLGQSNVVYLRDVNNLSTTVELTDLDEISASLVTRRKRIAEGGVVAGNYEVVESLLIKRC